MFWEAGAVEGHTGRLIRGFKAACDREQVSALKGGDRDLLAGHRTQDTFLTGEAAVPFT